MNKRTDKAKAACVIGFILALGGLVSACGSPQPKESPVPPKPLTAEDRVRWYQTCWTDFNEKKWDDLKTCYAPIATSQQPVGLALPRLLRSCDRRIACLEVVPLLLIEISPTGLVPPDALFRRQRLRRNRRFLGLRRTASGDQSAESQGKTDHAGRFRLIRSFVHSSPLRTPTS